MPRRASRGGLEKETKQKAGRSARKKAEEKRGSSLVFSGFP
jgi:hypothetical protein